MKHLLIILSLLLLSSPVIGQETGVLYQYETSSGIQWKPFGDGKVQPKYKGEIKNGKMDGLGVLIYPYGEKSVIGEWKNGKEWNTKHNKKDGKLLGKYIEGKQYMVLFLRSEFNRKTYRSDYEWLEDNHGKYLRKYIGEIKEGKPNGFGKLTDDGRNLFNEYEGKWRDGRENGEGTLTWSDGSKIVGVFRDGETWTGKSFDKDGNIKSIFKNGQKIFGSMCSGESGWSNDCHFNSDLIKFYGDIKNSLPNGKGSLLEKSFVTRNYHKKYEGEWKDGKKHGKGTQFYSGGGKSVGEFKNGESWNGTSYDDVGNVKGRFVNGKYKSITPP